MFISVYMDKLFESTSNSIPSGLDPHQKPFWKTCCVAVPGVQKNTSVGLVNACESWSRPVGGGLVQG